MLKKVFHIILALMLLTATNGYAVSKHYCGDKLVSVSLFAEANDCCDGLSDDCCRNTSEYFQIDQQIFIPFSGNEIVNYSDIEALKSGSYPFKQQNQHDSAHVFKKEWFQFSTPPRLAFLQKFLL